MGRPSSYKPEYAEQAIKLCKLGATDRELSDFFKVAESTINLWKLQHADFSESLKRGKSESDARVEQSLYRRALGYEHDEVHISAYEGEVTMTPIVKHYPPDTVACIFWLKNRRPDEWRDRVLVDATVRNASEALTDAALADIATGGSQRASEPPPGETGTGELH